MKKRTFSSTLKSFGGLSFATFLMLSLAQISVYGQKSSTDDLRGYLNTMKNKTDQIYTNAEQAAAATTINAANASGRSALVILEEAKGISKNAQTAFDALSTPENKNKCGRHLTSIASDLLDLQNKIHWETLEANKIVKFNEMDEIKYAANEMMTEIKKMNDDIAEAIVSLGLIDKELNAVD